MSIEDKYLDEELKSNIKTLHDRVNREMKEIKDILDKIPEDYEFYNSLLRDTSREIVKHFDDIKSGLSFLNKRSHSKMVF